MLHFQRRVGCWLHIRCHGLLLTWEPACWAFGGTERIFSVLRPACSWLCCTCMLTEVQCVAASQSTHIVVCLEGRDRPAPAPTRCCIVKIYFVLAAVLMVGTNTLFAVLRQQRRVLERGLQECAVTGYSLVPLAWCSCHTHSHSCCMKKLCCCESTQLDKKMQHCLNPWSWLHMVLMSSVLLPVAVANVFRIMLFAQVLHLLVLLRQVHLSAGVGCLGCVTGSPAALSQGLFA